jgi:hypothetical protein
METQVTDFRTNPLLKELMVNYYGIRYEMSASEDDLLLEYHWLSRNGNLQLLFECEKMSNEWKAMGRANY